MKPDDIPRKRTRREVTELLAEVEKRFDVNSLYLDDTCVWPLLRWHILMRLENPQMPGSQSLDRQPAVLSQTGNLTLSSISRQARAVKSIIATRIRRRRQLQLLRRSSPVDFLCLSHPAYCSDELKSGYYDRVMDPLINLAKQYGSCLKLEVRSSLGNSRSPRFEQTTSLYLPHLEESPNVPAWFKRYISKRPTIQKVEQLSILVKELTGDLLLDQDRLVGLCRKTLYHRAFFSEILEVLQPKAVFVAFHHIYEIACMLGACARRNIPTIEIQHGQQGAWNASFTHWTKIPPDGYEFLPNYFWVWGEQTRTDMERWRPEACRSHRPVVGGYQWASKWTREGGLELPSRDEDYLKDLAGHEKVILYTHQPGIDLPDIVVEAMRRSPSGWQWLIRLHPKERDLAPQLAKDFKARGIDRCEIERPTKAVLYALMKYTDHIICSYSSTAYEGMVMGKPVSIVHPHGLLVFRDYIDRGLFNYAQSTDELLNQISRDDLQDRPEEPVPYIEDSPYVAVQCLELILSDIGISTSLRNNEHFALG